MAVAGSSWVHVPGIASDVSVAPDGWGVVVIGSNFRVYLWDGGNGWTDTQIDSPVIAAGLNGELWFQGVVNLGTILVKNLRTGAHDEFSKPPSAAFDDLAVGANGSVFYCDGGSLGTPGIWVLDRGARTWNRIDAGSYGTRIAGGNGSNPWHIGDGGRIYRWSGGWVQVDGIGYDIAVGSADEAWHVGGEDRIYHRNGAWNQVDGNARRISAGPGGYAWVTNANDQIFRRV